MRRELHVFEKDGTWFCVCWPICGVGSTEHYARVDYELRKLLWVPYSELRRQRRQEVNNRLDDGNGYET